MTASTLKGAIKGTLKGILNTAAPVFSRRSAMDSSSARETLLGFSPPPTGTAAADNRLLEPECDLQIVIPAYNVEAYLAQCMDSVLAQETKYTYRVILVDDGATDTTPAIADTYSDDPRVTVIHQRNKGLSGARNTGIREMCAPVPAEHIVCFTQMHETFESIVIAQGTAFFEGFTNPFVGRMQDNLQFVVLIMQDFLHIIFPYTMHAQRAAQMDFI